jgi:hypothetical protein
MRILEDFGDPKKIFGNPNKSPDLSLKTPSLWNCPFREEDSFYECNFGQLIYTKLCHFSFRQKYWNKTHRIKS